MLDVDGQPIAGLYAAGELGSIWGSRYRRIAGRTVASELAVGASR